MCAWRTLTALALVALSACSFPPPADVDDDVGDDVDGGIDGTSPDATPEHRFTRVFLIENGTMSVADVNDGVPSTTHQIAVVNHHLASQDGSTVVYSSGGDVFAVKLGSNGVPGEPARVGGGHSGGTATVMELMVTPDGGRAIYGWGDPTLLVPSQYYVVDISTTTPGSPVPVGNGVANSVSRGTISPDGLKFAFIEGGGVYMVDISAPTPSATITVKAANSAHDLSRLRFSETSDDLSFVGDVLTDEVYELFVVDVSSPTPGAVEKASAALPTDWDVEHSPVFDTGGFSTSGDGALLVYGITNSTQVAREIFAVDISGAVPGSARKVNDDIVAGGAVSRFEIQSDGKRIAYIADQRTDDVVELFVASVVDAVPSTPQRVSGALVGGGDVVTFALARDGSGLWYIADQRTNDVLELFYVDLRGAAPSAPQVVNAPLPTGGDVGGDALAISTTLSRDGARLAYAADQAADGQIEMFIVDVSTGTPATAVPLQMASGPATAIGPVFSRDGSLVFWSASAGADSFQRDAWMVDLAGSTPWEPVRLTSGRPAGVIAVSP